MELRRQNGISAITLSVAIVILVIITSVLVYNAKDGLRIRSLNELYNDIENLNNKVSSYYIKYGDIPKFEKYENLTFLETADGSQINPNNGDDYYVIDLKSLEGVSLNYGRGYDAASNNSVNVNTLTDLYIINEQSHTIYYPQGIEVSGVNYYTSPDEWTQVELVKIENSEE